MIALKKREFINMDGELETGLNKNEHARELQRLRKKGYSLEESQKITGVKRY